MDPLGSFLLSIGNTAIGSGEKTQWILTICCSICFGFYRSAIPLGIIIKIGFDISWWMNIRIPTAYSMSWCICWPKNTKIFLLWGMTIRASTPGVEPISAISWILSGIMKIQRSSSWSRIIAPIKKYWMRQTP